MASASRSFDAFLSYNSADKPLVKEIDRWLADEAGLRVWPDEWDLVPGEPWQEGLDLYDRRCGVRLTLRSYQQIGRIEGALTRRAEEEFEKLDHVEQEALRKMFVLCLFRAGKGTEDTRRRAGREELLAVGEDPRVAESVLAKWTDPLLLTTRGDEARRHQVVDAAEALIRKWRRLTTWMGEGQEEARMVDVLRQESNEWQREGRRLDYLFHGATLVQPRSCSRATARS
ncbi:MAG: TIR domain-containing protein [bacterium]|nr:TIR domain-containing protein [bacterium]